MNNMEIKKAKYLKQGLVILGCFFPIVLAELITGLALLIWHTKIALFFFGISTVLLIVILILFGLWIISMRQERNHQ